MSNKALH